jgi:hypothetical protein
MAFLPIQISKVLFRVFWAGSNDIGLTMSYDLWWFGGVAMENWPKGVVVSRREPRQCKSGVHEAKVGIRTGDIRVDI